VTEQASNAELICIGTELTTGATADTNARELARELTAMGVQVVRMTDLPDDLSLVSEAFAAAIHRADVVISTGGLGPTPDDLTREAIAAAVGLEPFVDPELEHWLRSLFRRRGIEMPESNLKQAWLVPGATALHNAHGTAPGWWLEPATGKIVVALPGPPREMRPMWEAEVRPRLTARGVGVEEAHETLRLTGVGESALVGLIGEEVLRGSDPQVATYSRPDAVDVRISSRGAGAGKRVAAAVEMLLPRLGRHVFARDSETWADAIGRLLAHRSLATVEVGTAGQLAALLGTASFLLRSELVSEALADGLKSAELAERARHAAGSDIALAVRATPGEADTHVELAIASASGTHAAERETLLGGREGQRRAALAACTAVWQWLREDRAGGN
jgi:nicotinamide-nucleotide amidase